MTDGSQQIEQPVPVYAHPPVLLDFLQKALQEGAQAANPGGAPNAVPGDGKLNFPYIPGTTTAPLEKANEPLFVPWPNSPPEGQAPFWKEVRQPMPPRSQLEYLFDRQKGEVTLEVLEGIANLHGDEFMRNAARFLWQNFHTVKQVSGAGSKNKITRDDVTLLCDLRDAMAIVPTINSASSFLGAHFDEIDRNRDGKIGAADIEKYQLRHPQYAEQMGEIRSNFDLLSTLIPEKRKPIAKLWDAIGDYAANDSREVITKEEAQLGASPEFRAKREHDVYMRSELNRKLVWPMIGVGFLTLAGAAYLSRGSIASATTVGQARGIAMKIGGAVVASEFIAKPIFEKIFRGSTENYYESNSREALSKLLNDNLPQ